MLSLDEFIEKQAGEIRKDKISSASTIQRKVLDVIKAYVETPEFYHNRTELLQGLAKFSNALCKAKPLMGGIYTITHTLLRFIEELPKHERNIRLIRTEVLNEIQSIEDTLNQMIVEIENLGPKLIINQNTIFTLSHSTYIKRILLNARKMKKKFSVNVLVSGPGREGETLAMELAEQGIKVKLFPDTEFARALSESTFVLIGCDRITEAHFVNKVGSATACIVAKEFHIPVYLVGDSFKILLKREYLTRFDEEDPSEISGVDPEKVQIQNIYFEETPLQYVSKVVMEKGIFERDEFIKRFLG